MISSLGEKGEISSPFILFSNGGIEKRSASEMKCKSQNHDDGAGVCANCLRERLQALVATREDHSQVDSPFSHRPSQPLPLPLPPSASPLHCRLRSNVSVSSGVETEPSTSAAGRRAGSTKFSILSILFGHRHHHHLKSDEVKHDAEAPKSPRTGHWLPGFIHSRRSRKKKISRLFSADDAVLARTARPRGSCRGRDRGLSPEPGGSAPESGYTTGSPGGIWWRPSPSPAWRETAEHNHHGRGLAGFAVCLSPLVRPSGFNRRRFQSANTGFSGELKKGLSPRHHRPAAGGEHALFSNRSRRLARPGMFR